MYVGLIDYDALSFSNKFFPNLEIMKLSSFLKKNKSIVKLILNFSDLEKYSKLYLRKNINNNDYPSSLILDKRCEYGGLAFTNNNYLPMNEEIEKSTPDFSIYEKYYSNSKIPISIKKQQNNLSKSCFIRLIYNNKIKDFYKNYCTPSHGGSVFVYDSDLFKTENTFSILNDIGHKTHIKFIYPQKIDNIDICKKICSSDWNYSKNKIIFKNNIILNKDFKDFCNQSKNFKTKCYFLIGQDKNNTFTENYLKQELNRTLNRAIYSVSSGSKLVPYCNRKIPQSNYKKALTAIEDWTSLNFTQQSYKEYVGKSNKSLLNFIEELSKKDSFFRELISVNPKKILMVGGKWVL